MQLEILSWNVNGIKQILQKGFTQFLLSRKPTILGIQEVRTQKVELPLDLTLKYNIIFNFGSKKGHAGTAVFTKLRPLKVEKSVGFERFDSEGRFLLLKFENFTLINVYMPHGRRDKAETPYKLEAYEKLTSFLRDYVSKGESVILLGDFNVARSEIDLVNAKNNKNNTMFTEEERNALEELIKVGFIDTFRYLYPDKREYSWFPYYVPNAREKMLGWRIDYIFVTEDLKEKVKDAFILRNVTGSDHCPVGIILEL